MRSVACAVEGRPGWSPTMEKSVPCILSPWKNRFVSAVVHLLPVMRFVNEADVVLLPVSVTMVYSGRGASSSWTYGQSTVNITTPPGTWTLRSSRTISPFTTVTCRCLQLARKDWGDLRVE